MVDKWVVDGKVAVVYSPGFGAGWSTWADWTSYDPSLVFDPRLAELVEVGDKQKVREYAKAKWPKMYQGGIDQLKVRWIPEGTEFRIYDYDGDERIMYRQDDCIYTA